MEQEIHDGPTVDKESLKHLVRLEWADKAGIEAASDKEETGAVELAHPVEEARSADSTDKAELQIIPRAGWDTYPVIVADQGVMTLPHQGAVLVAHTDTVSAVNEPATIKSGAISSAWASACALLVLSVFLFDFKTSMGASLVTFGGLFIWEALAAVSQRILASLAAVLLIMFGISGLDLSDQWNLAVYLGMASVIMYVALLTVEEEQNYITEWIVN